MNTRIFTQTLLGLNNYKIHLHKLARQSKFIGKKSHTETLKGETLKEETLKKLLWNMFFFILYIEYNMFCIKQNVYNNCILRGIILNETI